MYIFCESKLIYKLCQFIIEGYIFLGEIWTRIIYIFRRFGCLSIDYVENIIVFWITTVLVMRNFALHIQHLVSPFVESYWQFYAFQDMHRYIAHVLKPESLKRYLLFHEVHLEHRGWTIVHPKNEYSGSLPVAFQWASLQTLLLCSSTSWLCATAPYLPAAKAYQH